MTTMKLLAWILFCLGTANAQLTCPLSLLIPFHDGREIASAVYDDSKETTGSLLTREDHQRDGLTLLATALMAIQDFNNRNSSLVAELSNITECSLFYPTPTLLDSGRSATNITDNKHVWLTNTSCAVIGPQDNFAAQEASNHLIGTIVPAIAYGATAPILANVSWHPNVALGTVQWGDTVMALSEYLFANRRFSVAVLYEPGENLDSYDYLQVWENVIDAVGLNVLLSIIQSRSKDGFTERLKKAKQDGRRTIVVALNRDDNLEELASVAENLGMLSADYWWIFMDSFLSPQYIERAKELDSPAVQKLLKSTLVFQLLDGLVPINTGTTSTNDTTQLQLKFNDFRSEWETRGATEIGAQMNTLLSQSVGLAGLTVDEDFFSSNVPAYGASFIYDNIMAVGMTACAGELILDAKFSGASAGTYQFANRSLDARPLKFGVFALEPDDNDVLQAILVDSNANGEWKVLEEEEVIHNYLSLAAAIIGMALASIGIIFCIVSFAFLFKFRKDRIVSVSQPEFMYMICFGAALNGMSIFFISFDDGTLATGTLNTFCVLQVWLSRVGILIVYCAIFSKMWRVEKVTQMRRGQRIEVKDVLAPFAAMMLTCGGLLVAWTIVDPPSWTRFFYDGKLPRGEGTLGICDENLWFALIIDAVIVVAVAVSLWMSCKTRHLPEDISDSRRVHQTLCAHLVLQILNFILVLFSLLFRNTNLSYMARALYLFLITMSSVAFLVLPKMYYVRRKQKTGELPPGLQRGRTRVSGINTRTQIRRTQQPPQSHSRFTVNQARQPGSSMVSSGMTGHSSGRTESGLTTSTVTTNSRFGLSGRSLTSRFTSAPGLDSSNVSSQDKTSRTSGTSVLDRTSSATSVLDKTSVSLDRASLGLDKTSLSLPDKTSSSLDRASSVDMNSSHTSGLDFDPTSILKQGMSPSKGSKPSQAMQSVSFVGEINPPAPSSGLTAPRIDENYSETFSLPLDSEMSEATVHA